MLLLFVYITLTQTWLQVSVNIIEDYIILGGMEFVSMHAASIAKLLDLIVGNVNDRGLLSTLPVIDTLIQVLSKYSREVDSQILGCSKISLFSSSVYLFIFKKKMKK